MRTILSGILGFLISVLSMYAIIQFITLTMGQSLYPSAWELAMPWTFPLTVLAILAISTFWVPERAKANDQSTVRATITGVAEYVIRLQCVLAMASIALISLDAFGGNRADNHSGFDMRQFYFPAGIFFVVTLLVEAMRRFLRVRRFWTILSLALSMALTFLIALSDQCNYVVQYDLWLRRGMPIKGDCADANPIACSLCRTPSYH